MKLSSVLSYCFVGMLFLFTLPMSAKDKIDVKEIVFDHIGDSYGWHVITIDEQEITIPLPIIVKGCDGWHCFSSSRLKNGAEYEGFFLSNSETYKGKVVYRQHGTEVRPLDLSVTKNAFSLMINSVLLIALITGTLRWYKRHGRKEAPGGFVGMMEMLITNIYEEVIKPCVGSEYKRFAPYLLTFFFFIFFNNLMGLIPIFPGGTNLTGNIAVTFVLAATVFLIINLSGTKEYWKEIFWPDVPIWMKFPVPMMPVLEFTGVFIKPFALMIRLLANIMAGHSAVIGLTCLVFVTAGMGKAIQGGMTVMSVFFGLFMNCLELLVAFIQAYVFTMLSSVFIGMSNIRKNEINN